MYIRNAASWHPKMGMTILASKNILRSWSYHHDICQYQDHIVTWKGWIEARSCVMYVQALWYTGFVQN